MKIRVNVKQLGARRDKVSGVEFGLESEPHSVGELIREAVHTCVEQYNTRVRMGEEAKPLSAEAIAEMSDIGKIAFGINYGGKEADEAKAVQDAIQAYEDGLFRIFIGETKAGTVEESVMLTEGDSVTFIRLTMLTGRMW